MRVCESSVIAEGMGPYGRGGVCIKTMASFADEFRRRFPDTPVTAAARATLLHDRFDVAITLAGAAEDMIDSSRSLIDYQRKHSKVRELDMLLVMVWLIVGVIAASTSRILYRWSV